MIIEGDHIEVICYLNEVEVSLVIWLWCGRGLRRWKRI